MVEGKGAKLQDARRLPGNQLIFAFGTVAGSVVARMAVKIQ